MAGNSPIRKSFQVVRIIEAMPNQPQWHHSGRVCLPSQFLASILVNSGSDIPPLMAFDVAKDGFHIKCGVVEFTAKRGQIWMPDWMMERLRIGSQPDGQETRVTVTFLPILPKATSVLFREDESGGEILRLGAKVILEKHLRYFTVLSQGEVIPIFFNGRLYKLKIEETQPGPDVIIIDADINVDFLRPMLEEHASGVASPSLLGEPDFNWQPGDSTTIQFLRK